MSNATSGFVPPTGRRQYHEPGFVPPSRAKQQELPIKEFNSLPKDTTQSAATTSKTSFFSFRRQPSPAVEAAPLSRPSSSALQKSPLHEQRSGYDESANISGKFTTSGDSSTMLPSSRSSVLVDPYSPLPRSESAIRAPSSAPTPPVKSSTQTKIVRPSSAPDSSLPRLPNMHPELRSLVSLHVAHYAKVYFSGPMVRCNERNSDGSRPSKDVEWHEIWAQLGGTTLSVWDMKAVEEANQRGGQSPPSYINVTDAFLRIAGPANVPPTASSPGKTYHDIFTLNTAGRNLMLFSCPNTAALKSWVAALRLALWEKTRLEEIYTGHLLRMSLSDFQGRWKEPRTTLLRGRMEGEVKVRRIGHTEWKSYWAVVTVGQNSPMGGSRDSIDSHNLPTPPSMGRRNRISSLFTNRPSSPSPTTTTSPSIALYTSDKPKDRKKPIIVMSDVRQAFAVYPERVELINASTLIKVVGTVRLQDATQGMKGIDGWLLLMPHYPKEVAPPMEMIKWIVAIHDAFELYGRPKGYNWDRRNPVSQMYAYPVGEQKQDLFLLREDAETLDPRIDRQSAIREDFMRIVHQKVEQNLGLGEQQAPRPSEPSEPTNNAMRLPPLDFEAALPSDKPVPTPLASSLSVPRTTLAPITERGSIGEIAGSRSPSASHMESRVESPRPDIPPVSAPSSSSAPGPSSTSGEQPLSPKVRLSDTPSSFLDRPIVGSPPQSPHLQNSSLESRRRISEESYFNISSPSRPSSMGQVLNSEQGTPNSDDIKPVATPSLAQASRSLDTLPPRAVGSHSSHSSRTQPAPVPQRSSTPSGSHVSYKNLQRDVSPPAQALASTPVPPSPTPTSTQPPYRSQRAVTDGGGKPMSPSQTIVPVWSELGSVGPSDVPRQGSPAPFAGRLPRSESHSSLSGFANSRISAEVHSSPRSIGVQLRDPGSPSPRASSPLMKPSSPPLSPPPPRSSSRASYEHRSASPRRSSLSPIPDHHVGGARASQSSSLRPSEIRSSVTSSRPLPSVSRDLAPTPEYPRTSLDYATALPSDGPGIVERLRRQIAEEEGYMDEAGALYIAQKLREGSSVGHSVENSEGEDEDDDDHGTKNIPEEIRPPPRPLQGTENLHVVPKRKGKESAQPPNVQETTANAGGNAGVPSPLVRKPSGARPRGPRRAGNLSPTSPSTMAAARNIDDTRDDNDLGADALAALSFMEKEVEEDTHRPSPPPIREIPASPTAKRSSEPQEPAHFPSSFAASKAAAERKAKAQASLAASQAAQHKPGRSGAKPKPKPSLAKNTWDSSEEEDEEDEDEDDDDDASDDENTRGRLHDTPSAPVRSQTSTLYAPQAQHSSHLAASAEFGLRPNGNGEDSHRPRNLPSIPRSGSAGGHDQRSQSRVPSGPNTPPYDDGRPRTHYDDNPRNAAPGRLQVNERSGSRDQSRPAPAHRQNIWSTVLDPNKPTDFNPTAPKERETFVTIEPSETMTKAFAPQGLLQAGLQDKQDRSAKRQEEVARESGASYVNVPSKPPPPQNGLLGAITAHERDRKREGGVGAALTERERERRLAEERQRKIDELQRQQLEYAQANGGAAAMGGGFDFYGSGGQFGSPMMNPMMMGNPMMLNPMMMGAPMMAPGLSPQFTGFQAPPWGIMPQQQQMFAAQQAAAEAYRMAMMSFSQAGSAAPSEVGGPSAMRPTSPMMWGGMNPIASMYGMPHMTPQMTGQSWGGFGAPQPDMNHFGTNGQPSPNGRTSIFATAQQTPEQPHAGPSASNGNNTPRTDTPPTTKSSS